MMVSRSFDTYRAVNALKEAGFPDEQALAVVDTIGGAMTGGLATKADLAEVRTDLAEFKSELYRHLWLMGMGLVTLNVGLTVALIKLLP